MIRVLYVAVREEKIDLRERIVKQNLRYQNVDIRIVLVEDRCLPLKLPGVL